MNSMPSFTTSVVIISTFCLPVAYPNLNHKPQFFFAMFTSPPKPLLIGTSAVLSTTSLLIFSILVYTKEVEAQH